MPFRVITRDLVRVPISFILREAYSKSCVRAIGEPRHESPLDFGAN